MNSKLLGSGLDLTFTVCVYRYKSFITNLITISLPEIWVIFRAVHFIRFPFYTDFTIARFFTAPRSIIDSRKSSLTL